MKTQDMIDTVIDGYRIERLIGEGGFGVVYEGTEVALKRRVAIKMLKPGPVNERDLARFISEGRNLASLNHPNVVHIYRLGTYENSPYIVMEFVMGRTLRQMIGSDRPPVRRVLEIMRQVANGLAAIHAMGIQHRDLSPNNVMVTEAGDTKILDFGLSKLLTAESFVESHGYLVGTLFYVAPEQVHGRGGGLRTEIFSFGVMLYEGLTGVHPFRAEHQMSLLYNITQREPEPLAAHFNDCPPALQALVGRCLQKRPEDRPADMLEVERSLGEILKLPALESTATRPLPDLGGPRITSRNPYLNRTMIKHREDFFGRTQEVRRIFARLNATPPGSVSVVGDRKIGKSSLLNYVYSRSARHQYLEEPDRAIMIFLDLQQEKQMSVEAFVRTLIGIASFELRDRLDVTDCTLNLDGIRDMVQRLDAAGFRLFILLDEFEAVTTNSNFNLEFFSFLRFLANHYNVSYVTSSARDLQVLCHTKEISDSPFFNIFSTMRLSILQRGEAEELIRIPSERVGKPLGRSVEPILDMAGLFPFYLQMACSHAIEYLDDHPGAAQPDFREVRRRFYEEAQLHYRYVWDGFDPHEKSTVLRVAHGKSMPDALRHVLVELQSRHYVENDSPRPRLFATTFDEFVKSESGRQPRESLLKKVFGKRDAR
jgi:serine/threonine protein kinase